MTKARWIELMNEEQHGRTAVLTAEELAEGWHWCHEFDGLLVKGDPAEKYCGQSCVEAECAGDQLEEG